MEVQTPSRNGITGEAQTWRRVYRKRGIMKPNIKQLVKDRFDALTDVYGNPKDQATNSPIPQYVCTLGELQELLDLIPDEAIRQAVQDEDDRETAETLKDLHYHN